jgi:hypothetical protein
MKNIYLKMQHWILFLLFLFLIISSILELTIFHYATIIPNLEFAYGVNEIQSGKASQVFIARVIRGELWNWHFYSGLLFSALLLLLLINRLIRIPNIKKNSSLIVLFLTTLVLLVTGIARFNRGTLSFMSEDDKFWRHLMQDIHHYAAYLISIFVVLHVVYMIYLENKKIRGIISNMFTKNDFMIKSLLILVFATTVIQTEINAKNNYDAVVVITKKLEKPKDVNYAKAMEYYSGVKGFKYEERSFPNCPYDACTKDSRTVKSFSKDGKTYYTIKIHNFKKAKEYFDKSVEVYKNPLSAERNLIMILERINYKDKILDDYLLNDIDKTLGFNNKKMIKDEIYKNIQIIGKENSVKILFKVAEILEKGYMGIPKNSLKAKKFYKYVLLKANKNSLYYMLAKGKE